ncbi:MAG: UvrB/UvrC motif-containing protein, partial [Bacteroidota bacterium]
IKKSIEKSKAAKYQDIIQHEFSIAADPVMASWGSEELKRAIKSATEKMNEASKNLEFMEAAQYRDEIKALEKRIAEL